MHSEESTSKLLKEMETVSDYEELQHFRINHPATENEKTLSDYFSEYISIHEGMSASSVVKAAGLSREYGLAILNGSKKRPSRDRVIALCLGAGMNGTETNRALRYADCAALSPKNDRDCMIIIALNNHVHSGTEVNLLLQERCFEILNITGKGS